MIYNILINQKELSRFKGIDYDDAAILQLVKDMLSSKSVSKVYADGVCYVWISHRFVAEQLPMLKSKCRSSIFKRIQTLVDCELLQRHPDNVSLNRTYITTSKKFDQITGLNSKEGRLRIETGVQDSGRGRPRIRTGVVQDSGHNNTHKDNTHKNNIKEEFENFRKLYPGVKRKLDVEYENFKKKFSSIEEIIPLLLPAIESQKKNKIKLKAEGSFTPEWPHLKTWINQQRWTEEIPVEEAPQAINF